jgi:deoxyuridine 5'-triphosphate nucleotidohydrolase
MNNETHTLNIVKLNNWPEGQLSKAHDTDAGYDIMAAEDQIIYPTNIPITSQNFLDSELVSVFKHSAIKRYKHPKQKISTGFAIGPDKAGFCLIVPRSSVGVKWHLTLSNTVGIIDADYRNEIYMIFDNWTNYPIPVKKGERLAQLIYLPLPVTTLKFVDKLDDTERGLGGFGSSGV